MYSKLGVHVCNNEWLAKDVFYIKVSLHLKSWYSFHNYCFMCIYFIPDGCFICLLCRSRSRCECETLFLFLKQTIIFFRIKELGNTREDDQVTQVLALTCPCRFFEVQFKKGPTHTCDLALQHQSVTSIVFQRPR